MDSAGPQDTFSEVMDLARRIDAVGRETGLPYVAVSADLSDPSPMIGADGRPLAETVFRWVDPGLAYWKDRAFALRAGIIRVVRVCGEPFCYHGGKMHSWRQVRALEAVNRKIDPEAYGSYGVQGAIVAPIHSPMGVIGAVVWATDDEAVDVSGIFEARGAELYMLALKFLSAYKDAVLPSADPEMVEFTRREIQCLKWAAAGKTDSEIATIMGVSAPTIRFHMTNASRKLGVSGRSQTIRLATTLGYIGQGGGA
ncbi:transcriptional regulator, LuxR family [Hyphomonas neptunium ATCC 15444]|uniref:Transcriptional regulator, LuxR family n=2 Tax=Hyphomonas TaxID=85 RepID=Q0C339_HYPNA|nr:MULTISPECIES: LuxR C-terminal-related transcriptional regulator [Hyphomonas]ABI77606.1 transcriptional regulator, LuxR family [Hyphomonas neptunium ATCC 15444]KCZ95910.1 LuxR family transcriptional regulator [Hyphomonas hirschiana VP5]